jgi:hypothetical protein
VSLDAEKLYNLLPSIYRIRDAEQGKPLAALLAVIAEQVAVLEEDLAQLYDDQFIETCAEWAVPYIGDLIGYRTLHGVSAKTASPRAAVANTIAYRRRKGTAAVLEQFARDVTDWNARAVEFFELLATTQNMNHIRPRNWYSPNMRDWEALERLNTPFDDVTHTVDVRHIGTGQGPYNIPNVGIFLWRLAAYPVTDSPAFRLDDRRWLFSPLGNDMALFTRPETEEEITQLAEPINVPMPIGRRVLHEYLDAYYGKGKSLLITVGGADVAPTDIIVCDLSNADLTTWAHQPADRVAIDPVLGRIAFPENKTDVRVTCHYGFSADMGGGEYEREGTFVPSEGGTEPIRVSPDNHATIDAAFGALGTATGAIEIADSGRYQEALTIVAAPNQKIELRAANGRRPSIILEGDLSMAGGEGTEVTLNGLLISGGALHVPAGSNLRRLRLRHCTLVPGLGLSTEGAPEDPDEPSLVIEAPSVTVEIDHCIVGGLRIAASARVEISNSIVDAIAQNEIAYAAPNDGAGGRLHIENSTVIGKIHTVIMELVSNSIMLAHPAEGDTAAAIRSERKQEGCVRFSYMPLESQVPRRHRCRPADEDEATRVRPQFTSLRYGDPAYGQLSRSCAVEIRQGADDEAEMGAFHDLYQPQRESNLRVRLDEYLRFGLDAGIFYAS